MHILTWVSRVCSLYTVNLPKSSKCHAVKMLKLQRFQKMKNSESSEFLVDDQRHGGNCSVYALRACHSQAACASDFP